MSMLEEKKTPISRLKDLQRMETHKDKVKMWRGEKGSTKWHSQGTARR